MIFYSDSTKGFYDSKRKVPIPDDAIELTEQEYRTLINNPDGEIAIGQNGRPEKRPRPVTPQERNRNLDDAVKRHLEEQAQSEGFYSMLDAVSYADEPTDPSRQAKGLALRVWRSQCWLAYDSAIQSDPVPNAQQFIAQLPSYSSP